MEPDPDFDFEWEHAVADTYAQVVGEADENEGIGRQDAMKIAAERLLQMVEDGDLKPDIDDVIKRALSTADKEHTGRADKLIRDTAQGKYKVFEADKNLNTVVALGKGRRKLWRYVEESDLVLMDELRYANVRNAQESYNTWRHSFETTRYALRQYRNIEAAIADEAFGGVL